MIQNQLDTKQYRLNSLIIFFIYISVFINSFVFFKSPFEFYVGYLIYIVLLPGFIGRYGFNGNLFFIFLTLFVTGLVNVFLGNNTTDLFFKVFTGLTLSYFFYYYVVLEFDYNIEQLFRWYLKGAYIASVLGIYQLICYRLGFEWGYRFGFIFNKWGISPGGILGLRINSIFAEPTHLAAVLSAAFFVSVYNMFIKEPMYISRFKSVVIIAVYILSFSGLGQSGIFLTLLLLAINFGLVRYLVVAVPVGIVLFNIMYNNVPEFRGRLDGLVDLFSGRKFQIGKIHGSSFILYNNYVVAMKNFNTNFAFGTGIGSHPVAFDKFSMAKDIKTYGFNQNGADANSMLLRLISETGIFGVTVILVIIIKGYVRRNPDNESYHWLISNAILVMILLNLFRQGHYFLNGFPFFVILYYFNKINHKKYLESKHLADVQDDLIDGSEEKELETNMALPK